MDIVDAINTVLAVCGGISIIGGAIAVIWKWVRPAVDIKKRVDILEQHDKRDYEALRDIAERDSFIMEALVTMLDSQINGNNVEELKKTRAKLIAHLAKE